MDIELFSSRNTRPGLQDDLAATEQVKETRMLKNQPEKLNVYLADIVNRRDQLRLDLTFPGPPSEPDSSVFGSVNDPPDFSWSVVYRIDCDDENDCGFDNTLFSLEFQRMWTAKFISTVSFPIIIIRVYLVGTVILQWLYGLVQTRTLFSSPPFAFMACLNHDIYLRGFKQMPVVRRWRFKWSGRKRHCSRGHNLYDERHQRTADVINAQTRIFSARRQQHLRKSNIGLKAIEKTTPSIIEKRHAPIWPTHTR